MRFLLDHDVSARCVDVLQDLGHDVWTAAQAKLDDAPDDDLVFYADRAEAVFITQDKEIVALRWDDPMTRILRLKCPKPLASKVLAACLDDVLPFFSRHQRVIVVAARQSDDRIEYQISSRG